MERKAAHVDLEAEEKRYADAQREAREKLMAALAPRAPCLCDSGQWQWQCASIRGSSVRPG